MSKLRRPPVTAWALDQVARQQPALLEAVLDAGAELRAATERAMEGHPSGLRDAQAAERRAVDAAVTAAAKVLEGSGRSVPDTARLRMAASLRAAVVDEEVAGLLRAGVLDADRDAPGFGLDGLSVSAAPAAARRSRPPAKERRRREEDRPAPAAEDDEAAERRRITAEADEAEDRARRLEREATDAERNAARLAEAAADAAAEAQRSAARAEELEGQTKAAAEAAETARREAVAAAAHAKVARAAAR